MEQFSTLTDMISFLWQVHPNIRIASVGCYAVKFRYDKIGNRIPYEEIQGFRISDIIELSDDSLSINMVAYFTESKGKLTSKYLLSRFSLDNLVVVNAYKHRAEFISQCSIDFSYLDNVSDANLFDDELFSRSIVTAGKDDIVIGQWVKRNAKLDRWFNEIGQNRVIVDTMDISRNIDMSSL